MSTTNFWRRALTVAAFLLLATVPAVAQVQTGNVFGTVVDEQGSALPGVTITLTGPGAPQVFVTDGQGRFRFLSLSPGRYQLSSALEGFATVEYPNVNVSVGRNTEIEVTMSSAVEDVITVTAESPILDERKITTGTTVSEVELEKIPTARDPWVILQQAPGVLVDRVNVGGNESGQQSQFISPGTNNNNSAWSVDGVVITDMGAIGSSPTYYNFDSFEEMQVSTGGSDVSLATGGVTMNMVTKRGTNEWRGSGRYLLTDDSLEQAELDFDASELGKAGPFNRGNNTTQTGGRAQALFQQGNQIIDVKDFGAELGGPVIKDRLWVWGSWGTQEIDLLTLNGVRLGGDIPGGHDFTELPSYAVKLNAQVASNNSGIAFYHFGDKVKDGRNAGPTRPPATTWDQSGGTPIYKLEDTHIFNSSFYLTGMASQVDGGFQLIPKGGIEGENTVWGNGQIWRNNFQLYQTERPQEQAKIDGDYFFNAGSSNHNLKFGVGLRNAVVTSFSTWAGKDRLVGFELFDPPTGFARTDRNVENEMDYTSIFLQDTMTLGNLTANFGLRYDLQEGKINSTSLPNHKTFPNLVRGGTVPAIDMPFEWETITPRLGITYALGEERQTLLRASYSRFADQLHSSIVEQINPGSYRYGYFYWNDNGDGNISPNEVGDFYNFVGFDPNNPDVFESANSVDPNLNAPITDELVLGVEHALLPEFVIGLSATYRIYSDIMQGGDISAPLVFENGQPTGLVGRRATRNDFVLFDHLVGTLPNGETFRVPLFKLKPGVTTFGGNDLFNGDREQHYLGLSFTFNKRLSNNWLLRGHVTQSTWEWDVPDSAIINPLFTTSGSYEDGSAFLSGSGTGSGSKGGIFISPGWSFDISGLYQVAPQRPWGFNVAANLNGREGYAIPYAVTVAGGVYGDGLGGRTVRVSGDTDSFRHDDVMVLNGRIEKEFNLGEFGLTLGIDGFNLLNESFVLQRQIAIAGQRESIPPTSTTRFINAGTGNHVTEIVSPRIFRIGARISFR